MRIVRRLLSDILYICLIGFGVWCMFYQYNLIENQNFFASIPNIFKAHMILIIPTIAVALIIKLILKCEFTNIPTGMFSIVPYLITLIIFSFREAYIIEKAGIILSVIISLINVFIEGLLPFIAMFIIMPSDSGSSVRTYEDYYYNNDNKHNEGNKDNKKKRIDDYTTIHNSDGTTSIAHTFGEEGSTMTSITHSDGSRSTIFDDTIGGERTINVIKK